MWNNKKKALTFSFDDGVKQDLRLIEILNRYGLKATFNINSGLLGGKNVLGYYGKTICHDKVSVEELKTAYKGHEIAAHTLTHPRLTLLDEESIVKEVEEDRLALESICGEKVVGLAYPCGEINHDERVAEIVARRTGIRYARTIISTDDIKVKRETLYRYHPTCHILQENLDEIVDKFLSYDGEEDSLLYLWGHAYELDAGEVNPNGMDWEKFELLCQKLSNKADIFYGTNAQILL